MTIPEYKEGQDVKDPDLKDLIEKSIEEEELAKKGEQPEKKEEELEKEKPEKPLPPKSERPVEHIPAWKLKEAESKLNSVSSELELSNKERNDLKAKIEELSKQPPQNVDDEIREYAESIGSDPKAIQGLVGLLQKRFSPPADFQKIVEAQKERDEQEKLKQEAESEFEEHFAALSKKYPETSDLKVKLHEFAFSETYAPYSLEHIFMLERDNIIEPRKKGPEGSRGKAEGHTRQGELTEKDIDEMSDKEFMEYSEGLIRKGTLKKI